MNPEKFNEIRELTEDSILEVMRSSKPKESDIKKADMGLKYLKAVTSTELQKLSAVVQVAGLYSQPNREEIAKKIVKPMYNIIDSDIEFIPGSELKGLLEAKKQAEIKTQEAETKARTLENKMADVIDETHNKEKPIFAELVKEEYQQKREIMK